MEQFNVISIGVIRADENGMRLELKKEYAPALLGLSGFSHVNILWWFSKSDNAIARAKLSERSPYKNAPAVMGTFATRSPLRPNPIALSCAEIIYIDEENAVVGLGYIDADNNSPLLDIKPYTPSLDRVEKPLVPSWCKSWPNSVEISGDFDWSSVFNF